MPNIKNSSGMTLVFPSGLTLPPHASQTVSKLTPELSDAIAGGLLIEEKPMETTGETEKTPTVNGKKKQ